MKSTYLVIIAAVAVFLGSAVLFLSGNTPPSSPAVPQSEMPVAADAPDETQGGVPVPPMGAVSDVVGAPSADQVSVMPSAGDSPLLGKKWMLVWLAGADVPQDARAPYIEFDAANGRASGMGGCNRFSGPYQLDGDALTFPSHVAATMMACDNLDTEGAFFQTLERVARWQVSGDTLTLSETEGEEIARFKDVASTAP